MSRGLGRIERHIVDEILRANTRDSAVLVSSWHVFGACFPTRVWGMYLGHAPKPTPAQRKAVTRAMHSFVRKHPRYALIGGQGRRRLYLYEPGNPLSAKWAELTVKRGKPVSESQALGALKELTRS